MRCWIHAFCIAIASTGTMAYAGTHIITVGPNGTTTFSPATLTIPPGHHHIQEYCGSCA